MDESPAHFALILKQAKDACRLAAIEAYEDASIRGLCAQGAFEAAMQAIDAVTLETTDPQRSTHLSDTQNLFIRGWQRVGNQARALLEGVAADQFATQPGGVVNHPAWTLSHLIHYHPAILSLVQGRSVQDPATSPKADLYDEGSTPQPDASLYLQSDALMASYMEGHQTILIALQQAPASCFEQKPGLARWANVFPTTADTLVYLMLIHESQHLGQLMVWRRAMKLV